MTARRHSCFPARFLLVSSLLVAHGAAAENAAEGGEQPELTLELEHHNAMGDTFALVSATYLLDGKELLKLRGTELAERLAAPRLLRAPLRAGLHIVAMRLVYMGRSGVFRYVERYRFTMQGYLLIESRPGYGVKVISSARERKSLTVQWHDRPTFQLGALPQKAVVRVRLSPIERRAASDDDDPEAGLPPLAILISEEDARLLTQHLHEEAPQAPQPAPAPVVARVEASGCKEVHLHFALGQATLDRAARRSLEELSACLLRAPDRHVQIEGHCDQRGTHELNDRLGQARAEAASRFLVRRGVMPDRIEAASFGKRRPVCPESTEACHAQNRRADLRESTRAASSTGQGAAHPPANAW